MTISNAASAEEGQDRLSSLPDPLLFDILSRLPIEFATTTSVLSTRWRPLWTHFTNLLFKHSFPEKSDQFEKFIATVNHILRQGSSPKLYCISLELRFGGSYDDEKLPVFLSHLDSWMTQICSLKPDQITLKFLLNYKEQHFLPSCVFEAPSLVNLELSCGSLGYKLPDNGNITLPNLKKLKIGLSVVQLDFVNKLINSCPLLEDLDLKLFVEEKENHLVDISAENMKSLAICFVSRPFYEYHHGNSTLIINAPKLEYFKFLGDLVLYNFVKGSTTLTEADICLSRTTFEGGRDRHISLYRGISRVRSLTLYTSTLCVFNSVTYGNDAAVLPIFHNLTYLRLSDNNFGKPVIGSDAVPYFLLCKVKIIDFSYLTRPKDRDEMKLEEYILLHANVLEKFRVVSCKKEGWPEENEGSEAYEYEYCKALFRLPRSSPGCQIEFSGICISVSEDDFKKGLLTSPIGELSIA